MWSASDKKGGLLFGTAGVPKSTGGTSSLAGIKRIVELDLDCMEVEFVKGVKMGAETAEKIGEKAEEIGVRLSVHAPYYVNLNADEEGKRLASMERLIASARTAKKCGAESVVFHAGYYGKDDEETTFQNIKRGAREVVSVLRAERSGVVLRPETMGKRRQFGSLEEILRLCREVDGLEPCVDFSHIHAREGRGKANSYREFDRILRKIGRKLGKKALKNMHIHVSGAEYSDRGELKHLMLNESDFRYDEWVQALKDAGVEGMVICESPIQEHDAVLLKNLYLA
ncbi:MAG: TIM barrel protein [Candidatus Aminicenantes bacterium]|nr:MAG: TIM barrel protein [Candidatus Aminicenantes bacterium]